MLTFAESDLYLACRQAWYDKAVAYYGKGYVDYQNQYPEWYPDTYPGSCNMFAYVRALSCFFLSFAPLFVSIMTALLPPPPPPPSPHLNETNNTGDA